MNTPATAPAKRISKIAVNEGQDHILVSKAGPGKYTVEGFTGMKPHHDAFGFEVEDCASNVQNLDFTSDFYDCFTVSTKVSVGDCVFGTETIEGPTLDALRDAAQGLFVTSMDSQDV